MQKWLVILTTLNCKSLKCKPEQAQSEEAEGSKGPGSVIEAAENDMATRFMKKAKVRQRYSKQ